QRVDVVMSHEHATILRNHAPESGLEAKFSIEFAMACALTHRRVGLTELTDHVVQDRGIRALMAKVNVIETKSYSSEWKGAAAADQVLLTLNDGTCIESEKIAYAKGHAERPLDRLDLDNKFLDCVLAGGAELD